MGSVDGIGSVLPEYYQQELDIITKQHVKDLYDMKQQVDEAQSKLSLEVLNSFFKFLFSIFLLFVIDVFFHYSRPIFKLVLIAISVY